MNLLVPLLLAPPALADDEAVASRLARSMESLATKNAWDGVERGYQSIHTLAVPVERGSLLLATDALQLRQAARRARCG